MDHAESRNDSQEATSNATYDQKPSHSSFLSLRLSVFARVGVNPDSRTLTVKSRIVAIVVAADV